jgi:hypothetical protein
VFNVIRIGLFVWHERAKGGITMTETATKGGFVVTMRTKNVLGHLQVNSRVLEDVIRALNIPRGGENVDIQKAIDQVLSVTIYRDPE